MSYLSHKEYYPSVNSSLNFSNAEHFNVSVKHGYYEQFYPQQPLSENVPFQIYSSKDYFIDLTSAFLVLHVIVKKLTVKNQVQPRGYSVMHNLHRQISAYLNGMLVSTSNNLSNYASYIQFMLMTPMFSKLLRGF